MDELADLNPPVEEFVARAAFRSFNKSSLEFLRRSEIQHSITPEPIGTLHFIRPRQATQWDSFPQDDFAFWGATLGNTLISHSARRPKGALSWIGAKNAFLPDVLDLDAAELSNSSEWSTDDVEKRGAELAQRLGEVWYLDAE